MSATGPTGTTQPVNATGTTGTNGGFISQLLSGLPPTISSTIASLENRVKKYESYLKWIIAFFILIFVMLLVVLILTIVILAKK